MATTMEPESTHRSGPAALHCDCSGTPKSHGVIRDESSPAKITSPGALQIQLEEKYLLERVPSPVRIKPVKSANEPTSPELSPPPSPKRKREVEFSKDLKDVAFSGVLPRKNVDLARSQSTF